MAGESKAGPRSIHPSISTSLSLAECSAGAERLFIRLIAHADDQGRLLGDPRQVKALCLPMDENVTPAEVTSWLQELVAQEMVISYGSGERSFIQMVNWWKYQDAMRRARPSKWPPPPGWDDRRYGFDGAPTKLDSLVMAPAAATPTVDVGSPAPGSPPNPTDGIPRRSPDW